MTSLPVKHDGGLLLGRIMDAHRAVPALPETVAEMDEACREYGPAPATAKR